MRNIPKRAEIATFFDHLRVKRCRLKMVRLHEPAKTCLYEGVWIVGGQDGKSVDHATARSLIERQAHYYALFGYS